MLCGQVNSAQLVIHVHMVVLSLPSVPVVPISLNQLSRPATYVQQVNAFHECYSIWETCIYLDGILNPVSGFYCLEGASSPTPCPAGTVSQVEGLRSLLECSPCPPGFYCNISALSTPSGPCSAGQCLLLLILLFSSVRACCHKLLSDPFSQRPLLFSWSHRTWASISDLWRHLSSRVLLPKTKQCSFTLSCWLLPA